MSQKINPISNRLGIVQLWDSKISKYGRTFKNYTNILKIKRVIFNYINRLSLKNDFLIENVIIVYNIHQIFINIFIFNLKTTKFLNVKKKIVDSIYYWTKISTKITFFKSVNLGNSAFLINNYIIYLFLQKSNSPKKILQLVYNILETQKLKKKIVYTIYGLKKLELKGFKIEVSGCFESSRSQMSKTIKCNFGRIPLTKLNGYIDYSNDTFYTKFGSCGFKIWLFYEFK